MDVTLAGANALINSYKLAGSLHNTMSRQFRPTGGHAVDAGTADTNARPDSIHLLLGSRDKTAILAREPHHGRRI
jgi:hypothetical protein